jgi:hypothetical protein
MEKNELLTCFSSKCCSSINNLFVFGGNENVSEKMVQKPKRWNFPGDQN